MLFIVSFLVFPEGRLLSPRWRWVVRAAVAIAVGLLVSGTFETAFLEPSELGKDVATPLLHGRITDIASTVFRVLLLLDLGVLLLAAGSLVVRLRRAHGEEREQVRAFVLTVAVVVVALPISFLIFRAAVGVLLFPPIPLSAAVAILKYRRDEVALGALVVRATLQPAHVSLRPRGRAR